MMEIRNMAIIAHVDHGKTTLTDALLLQTGAAKEGVSMNSNALELERGITIYSKNAAINYKNSKINIVDTPGHADFGSEVERVLRAIDSVLLVVDAQEGPMPQTRFVLKKSLELGLKPIVIINKIDKPAADPAQCEERVLELFMELGASDEQANFPVVYANGKAGIAKLKLEDESNDLTPLLETIIKHVPSASSENLVEKPLRFQPFNLGYDNFLGRLAVGRVYEGVLKSGENIVIKNSGTRTGKISKIFTFNGLERVETSEAIAGDIALVAGLPDIYIGETVMKDESLEALPAIKIDEPTISLNFLVNNSPFGGREGKFVTSRQIREYLERELEVNVGLRVEFASGDIFSAEGGSASCGKVSGRGELHIAILLENMRRAGYELQVSQPQVIIKEEGGEKLEPFEEVINDAPAKYQGTIIERLGLRGFILTNLFNKENIVRLSLEGPTRGILGYRNQFTIDTNGKALGFSLWGLQDRGMLYIGPGTEVYKGMVIGNTAKGDEMFVNPTKGKELTNMRSKSSDEALTLSPPYILTIERGLEIMSEDEYLEITPQSVRLRKQNLVK